MTIYTYIVPAIEVDALNKKLAGVKGLEGLAGTFTTPVYQDGSNIPTHYIANGLLSDEEAAFLASMLPPAIKGEDVKTEGKPVEDAKATRVDSDPFIFLADYLLKMSVDAIADAKLADVKAVADEPIKPK